MLKLSPPVCTRTAVKNLFQAISAGEWQDGPCTARLESELARLASVPAENVVVTDSCTRALWCAGEILLGPGRVLRHWAETFPSAYTWAPYRQVVPFGEPADLSTDLWGVRRWTGRIVDGAHRFRPEEVQERFQEGAEAVCWSFGCQKELPGIRGGAIVFRHARPEAREWLRIHKGRMANADAAFLLGQLPRAGEWRRRRLQVLEWYGEALRGDRRVRLLTPAPENLEREGEFKLAKGRDLRAGDALNRRNCPPVREGSGHLCVILFPSMGSKERAIKRLARAEIQSSTHYPGHVVCERTLSVPCHPGVTRADVRRVTELLA